MVLALALEARFNVFQERPNLIVCATAFPFGVAGVSDSEQRVRGAVVSVTIDEKCSKREAVIQYWKAKATAIYVERFVTTHDSLTIDAVASKGQAAWRKTATFSRKPRLSGGVIVISDIVVP